MPKWRQPGAPILSYGQEFLFLMTPLTAALGASTAGSIAIVGRKTPKWLAYFLLGTPIIVVLLVLGFWRKSYALNGADVSDWILVIPLLIVAPICFAQNLVSAAVRQFLSRSD